MKAQLMECEKCGSNNIKVGVNPNKEFALNFPISAIGMHCLDCGRIFFDKTVHQYLQPTKGGE